MKVDSALEGLTLMLLVANLANTKLYRQGLDGFQKYLRLCPFDESKGKGIQFIVLYPLKCSPSIGRVKIKMEIVSMCCSANDMNGLTIYHKDRYD